MGLRASAGVASRMSTCLLVLASRPSALMASSPLSENGISSDMTAKGMRCGMVPTASGRASDMYLPMGGSWYLTESRTAATHPSRATTSRTPPRRELSII